MSIRVGDVGRALTAMSPSGAVEVNGVRLDARSDGRFIAGGSEVVIVRGDPTGYVVREYTPGSPLLPNHGEPIRKADFQMNRAEVTEVERAEAEERRRELMRRLRWGSVAAGVLGVLGGAASAGLGWHFNWAEVNDSVAVRQLVAGSMVAAGLWAVVLFLVTGWFTTHVLPAEDGATFEPDLLAVVMGLVGAAIGFWDNMAGRDVAQIAGWSVALSLAFAALTTCFGWLIGLARTAKATT